MSQRYLWPQPHDLAAIPADQPDLALCFIILLAHGHSARIAALGPTRASRTMATL